MKTDKLKAVTYYIIAKLIYYIGYPFFILRGKAKQKANAIKYEDTKKQADADTANDGKTRYIVFANGKFYIYNKGGMMNLTKAIKKKTKRSVNWRELYLYKTK